MFSNVLVLCVGNVCRSPMAAAMLRQHLGATGVRVQSAGIAAVSGAPLDLQAQEVLQMHHVRHPQHKARQVNRELLHQADLILLMEQSHMSDVLKQTPEVRGKTFLIGKWQQTSDVADPYRQPRAAFEQTYAHLSGCIDDWLPLLQSGATG